MPTIGLFFGAQIGMTQATAYNVQQDLDDGVVDLGDQRLCRLDSTQTSVWGVGE